MKIAIVKETEELEKRVAASPETVKKLLSLGFSVDVAVSYTHLRAHETDS